MFPEGLNGEPEALQLSFQEVPLWNATSTDGPGQDPPLLEVVLSSIESETTSLTQVPPPSSHQMSTWHPHGPQPTPPGGLGMPTAESSVTSAPISQHSMPGRKLPSAALGALPSIWAEDLLSLEGMELVIPDPMATSSQASPSKVTLEHASKTVQVSHSPSLPTISKTLDMASIPSSP